MDNKEKLDNPLVVHNKNDASYENSDEMDFMFAEVLIKRGK